MSEEWICKKCGEPVRSHEDLEKYDAVCKNCGADFWMTGNLVKASRLRLMLIRLDEKILFFKGLLAVAAFFLVLFVTVFLAKLGHKGSQEALKMLDPEDD